MTQPPQDQDELLVNFLRQHRPVPPASSMELEAQIVKFTDASATAKAFSPNRILLIPAAIATGIIMTWSSIATQKSTAELASLETFIENTWDHLESEPTELDIDWVPHPHPANSAGNTRENSSFPHYQPTSR